MNIIIINHYAGSPKYGMEYRHFYLAKEWTELGHKVCIVAASFSHLRNMEPVVSGSASTETVDGVQYIWLKTPPYKGNGIARVINMLSFGLEIVMYTKKIMSFCDPDLVIASSPHPFIIFGANRLARLSDAKLLFEVRDLWPLTLTELNRIPERHPFIAMMQKCENFAYKVSDRVISLLPKADTYMRDHGLKREKFSYIPNGINISEWQYAGRNICPHRTILTQLKNEAKFIVGYAGSHGLANDLDTLIDAATLMQSEPVAFVLVGSGPEKKRLVNVSEQRGLSNINFLNSISKSAIPELLSLMDVLYIGWKNDPLYRFGISPNKIMDYMMAGKPVIHAVSAPNDMVAESCCGLTIQPENPNAAAGAIIRLMNMTETERKSMGLNGKNYVAANHDYKILAKRYLESINCIS